MGGNSHIKVKIARFTSSRPRLTAPGSLRMGVNTIHALFTLFCSVFALGDVMKFAKNNRPNVFCAKFIVRKL